VYDKSNCDSSSRYRCAGGIASNTPRHFEWNPPSRRSRLRFFPRDAASRVSARPFLRPPSTSSVASLAIQPRFYVATFSRFYGKPRLFISYGYRFLLSTCSVFASFFPTARSRLHVATVIFSLSLSIYIYIYIYISEIFRQDV